MMMYWREFYMNSAKRFDMVRTVFSVLIALAISFVIIFLVSDQPLEAIKYLLIGPFTNKRSMGNVVDDSADLHRYWCLHYVFCKPDQPGR